MKERELVFDRKRHLCYSRAVKKLIRQRLKRTYPPEEAERLWEEVQCCYVDFLADLPPLGGKQNRQAGPVYDCLALFACWTAEPEKPTLEELEAMNCALFVPKHSLPSFLGLERPFLMRIAHSLTAGVARKAAAHAEEWTGNYHMEVEPFEPELGVRYTFTTCPIADFAKAHGLAHLMPAMCNPDYPTLSCLGGRLIRRTTCANGPCCDFWMVGRNSRHCAAHPEHRGPDGYRYND